LATLAVKDALTVLINPHPLIGYSSGQWPLSVPPCVTLSKRETSAAPTSTGSATSDFQPFGAITRPTRPRVEALGGAVFLLGEYMARREPVQLRLVDSPVRPKEKRAPTQAFVDWAEFCDTRRETYAAHGLEVDEEKDPDPIYISMAMRAMRAAAGSDLYAIFDDWFQDLWAARLDPPFTLRALASPKVFPNRLAKVRGQR
jgi:hypothetical protein